MKRITIILVRSFSIILILAGLALILRQPYLDLKRKNNVDTYIEDLEAHISNPGTETPMTITVDPAALSIDGEYEGMTAEEIQEEMNSYSSSVTLTGLGILTVESVGIRLPVWDSAGTVALRYGAGHYEGSVMPGEIGNCAILGHHFINYEMFTPLFDVELGDIIEFDSVKGAHFEYTVDEILTVPPDDLPSYLTYDSGASEAKITLITCAYTGNGKQRLLVRGTLSYKFIPAEAKDD